MQASKAVTLALMVFAALSLPLIHASGDSNDFTVTASLSARCRTIGPGTSTLDFGAYTAFQSTPATATGLAIAFECTRGLEPTELHFDGINGTANGGGVLAGLNYDMEIDGPALATGDAATAMTTGIGTGDLRTYLVSGTMAAGQAGTLSGPTSHVRTLIIIY